MKTNEKDRAEKKSLLLNAIGTGVVDGDEAWLLDLMADVEDAKGLVKALAFWCSDRDHRPNELLDLAAAFLKEPKQ